MKDADEAPDAGTEDELEGGDIRMACMDDMSMPCIACAELAGAGACLCSCFFGLAGCAGICMFGIEDMSMPCMFMPCLDWPDDEAGIGTEEEVAGAGICMPCIASRCAKAGSANIKLRASTAIRAACVFVRFAFMP
jgi:hypothetical protein